MLLMQKSPDWMMVKDREGTATSLAQFVIFHWLDPCSFETALVAARFDHLEVLRFPR